MGIEELVRERLLQDAEEKGRKEGLEKAALLMLAKGLEPGKIAAILNISYEQVLKLQQAQKQGKKPE